jgi:hypothetical protein
MAEIPLHLLKNLAALLLKDGIQPLSLSPPLHRMFK